MLYDVTCTNGANYVFAQSGQLIYQSTDFEDALALAVHACKRDGTHQVRVVDSTRKRIASGQKTFTLEEIQRLYQLPDPSEAAVAALDKWRQPLKRTAGGTERATAEEQPPETTGDQSPETEEPEPMSQSEKSHAARTKLVFNSSHARRLFFKGRADQAWEAFLRNGGKSDDEHAWQKYVQARFKLAVQAWEEFKTEDSGTCEKAERSFFISAAQAGKANHQSR